MPAPECAWEFPKSGGGQLYGLNNAGVALFSADTIYSFTRETIQNSVDAVRDKSRPVEVTFELLTVPRQQVPGIDQLLKHVEAARRDVASNMSEEHFVENGKATFDRALDVLRRPEIPILRCGDTNTTGLTGGEGERDNAWVRLIRRQGSPAMHGAGGGSYGIGQMAPFAASLARTVFYGTKTDSLQRFIGKSIWCSVQEGADSLQHIGFYGTEANVGRGPLDRAEWLPPFAARHQIGTDIFVVGFHTDRDWAGAVTDAVLTNFFAAIARKKLRVVVHGETIDHATIGTVLDARIKKREATATTKAAKSELRSTLVATRVYLKALSSTPATKELPKLGTVELFVARDDDGPDKVAHMRSPLMLVHERKFPVLAKYGAVFLCDTAQGNRLLREFEGPEHNSWVKKFPGREQVISSINDFIREQLGALSTESSGEEDVRELEEYLPEELPSAGVGPTAVRVRQSPHDREAGVRRPRVGVAKVTVERPPRRTAHRRYAEDSADAGDDFEGDGGAGTKGGDGGSEGGGDAPGDGNGTRGRPGEGNLRRLREDQLRLRSWFAEDRTEIVVTSSGRGEAHALFRLVGEDGAYALPQGWQLTNEDGSAASRDDEGRYVLRFPQAGSCRMRLSVPRRVSLSLELD